MREESESILAFLFTKRLIQGLLCLGLLLSAGCTCAPPKNGSLGPESEVPLSQLPDSGKDVTFSSLMEQAVAENIKGLSSPDPVVRAQAATYLGNTGRYEALRQFVVPAIPFLIASMADAALIGFDKNRGYAKIKAGMSMSFPGWAARYTLRILAPASIEPLISALQGKDLGRRCSNWRDLWGVKDPATADLLVRDGAAQVLGWIGPPARQATDALRQVAENENEDKSLRENARKALASIQGGK